MTAMTAATLDQLSDGRMLLGIGSSGPQVAEGWHGVALRQAAPAHARVRRGRAQGAGARAARVPRRDDRAAAARRAGQGAQADDRAGAGAHPDLPGGDRAEEHARWPGEIADGWIPTLLSPEHLPELRPLARGGRRACRALARRLRHRADGERLHHRRPRRARATPCGRSSRSTSAAWARASRTSTTSSCSATASRTAAQEVQDLYLEGKQGRGDGGAARRAHRHGLARRARGRRARAPARLPRRRRRHARRHADGLRRRRSGSTQLRLVAELPSRRPEASSSARSATPGTRSRSSRSAARCARAATTSLLETWTRWEPDAEREGHALRGRARVPRSSRTRERPLKPYEAVVRAADVTRPLVGAVRARRRRRRHPHPRAGARGRARGRAGRDAHPPRRPAHGAGLAALLHGRAPAAHRRRRAGCGARWTRSSADGLELGRDELNETRAPARAGAAATGSTAGSRRSCALVATFPQLEYPRRARRPGTHVVGPLLWEPPAGDVELPPGRRAARARGALDVAGPRPPPAARVAAPGWPACRCASWRPGTAGRRPRRCRSCRPTRASSSGSPTRGRCRAATSSSATAATAPSRARWRRAAWSSRRRPRAT